MIKPILNKLKQPLTLISLLLFCYSCESDKPKNISFYHWKSRAEFSAEIEQTLNESHSKKIYMHYFDIEPVKNQTYYDDGIYPTYVIKDIDPSYSDFEIVPVIYITNQVFKTENIDIEKLVNQIKGLIHQISLKYFEKEITSIQIDCDWTQSTKNAYFELLNLLQEYFEIDVTIRLHQIKYKEKTGVPPVKHGTLMLYNMGDFKNNDENSILESSIVQQYIDNTTNYPISLHLGLPIFSQTILTNNDNEYKIIKDTDRHLYETDKHFEAVNHNNFKIIKDTLYKGFYLTSGFNLKLEEINQNEIIKSYQIIEKSKLNIDEIILYHLDEKSISNIDIKTLINEL